jgi:serine phosphatase RsbU (regulator of sigma subunit)
MSYLFKRDVKFSLFLKFTLVISITLILILSIMGRLIIHYTGESLLTEEKRSNQILTDLVARISAGPIQRLDYSQLEGYTESLQNGDDEKYDTNKILSVIFYDKHGNKINFSGIEHDKIELPDYIWEIEESEIIGDESEVLGKVVIIFSLESIYQTTDEISNTFNIAIGLLILILIVLITLLLLIIIIKPLKKLTRAAESLSKGDFDFKIGYHSNDEIGFLGNTFRKMRKEIKQSFKEIQSRKQELKDYNLKLGEMVEQRTVQLKNAMEEIKERNQQMLADLKMARSVQLNIIPKAKDFPQRKELQFGYKYSSMESVGGDLYDVVQIDRNRYGFLIADVSGHGVPAALITSMAKVSFKANSKHNMNTAEVCSKVNLDLYSLIGNLMYFITAYYCTIDIESGEFEYTNAGHHPALLLPANERKVRKLDTDGIILGSFDRISDFESRKVMLNEGDRILLFTDGIVEARNDKMEIYGYDKLMHFIHQHYSLSPLDFVNKLEEDIENHCEGREQDDDMAVLCIEYKTKSGQTDKAEESMSGAVKNSGSPTVIVKEKPPLL